MNFISVGDTFESFDAFQAKLKELESILNCVFVIKQSKSTVDANRTVKNGRPFNAKLKYRFAMFTCRHYGNAQKNKTIDERNGIRFRNRS